MTDLERLKSSKKRPLLGSSFCVWHGDRVLAIQRANEPFKGAWSLPGGLVEAGETVAEATLRELFEETGARAEMIGVAGMLDVIGRKKDGSLNHHFVVIVHAGTFVGGDLHAGDGVEAIEWLLPEELLVRETTPDLGKALAMVTKLMEKDPNPTHKSIH